MPVEHCETLYDCLGRFFDDEVIKDEYVCKKCKVSGPVRKKIIISKLPNILVIHLKRFKSNAGNKVKLTKKI